MIKIKLRTDGGTMPVKCENIDLDLKIAELRINSYVVPENALSGSIRKS